MLANPGGLRATRQHRSDHFIVCHFNDCRRQECPIGQKCPIGNESVPEGAPTRLRDLTFGSRNSLGPPSVFRLLPIDTRGGGLFRPVFVLGVVCSKGASDSFGRAIRAVSIAATRAVVSVRSGGRGGPLSSGAAVNGARKCRQAQSRRYRRLIPLPVLAEPPATAAEPTTDPVSATATEPPTSPPSPPALPSPIPSSGSSTVLDPFQASPAEQRRRGSALCSQFRKFLGSSRARVRAATSCFVCRPSTRRKRFCCTAVPQGFRTRARAGSTLSSASSGGFSAVSPSFASRAEASEMMAAVIAENPAAFLILSYPPGEGNGWVGLPAPCSFFNGWGFGRGRGARLGQCRDTAAAV